MSGLHAQYGRHRLDCGGPCCLRSVLVRIKDAGPDGRTQYERDLAAIHGTLPDAWYGGREVTDGIKPYSGDCEHDHTTKYLDRRWCRDCGRWLS